MVQITSKKKTQNLMSVKRQDEDLYQKTGYQSTGTNAK